MASLKQKLLSDEDVEAVEMEDTATFGTLKSQARAPVVVKPSTNWGWPATVYLLVFSTHISLNIILQHAIAPATHFGEHCFTLVKNGWLSDCGVAFSFHIPACYVFIGGLCYWFVADNAPKVPTNPKDRVHLSRGLVATGIALSLVMAFVEITIDLIDRPDVTPLLLIEQTSRIVSWTLSAATVALCRRNYRRIPGPLLVFWVTQYFALIMELGAFINFMSKKGFQTSLIPFVIEFVCGTALCAVAIRFVHHPAWSSNEEIALISTSKQTSQSWPPFSQVWAMFSPDWPLLLLGVICAIGQGLFTIFSLQRFARVMSGIAVTEGFDEVRKQTILFFLYTFILAAFLAVQSGAFGTSGERAIRRIRDLMYRKLLEQDRQFLDRKENSIGTLVARLTSDADAVGAVLTTQFSDAVTPAVRAISGFVLLFKISWQLSILALAVSVYNIVFVSVRSTYVTAQFSGKYSDRRAKAVAKGTEVLKGIDAVQLCGEQPREGTTFRGLLDLQYNIGKLRAMTEGVFQASEVFLTFTIVGVAIWYGSILILQGYMKVEELASFALVTMNATSSLGQMTRVFPQMANAAGPAGRVLLIIHRNPQKDDYIDQNRGRRPDSLQGEIELRDCRFTYSESTRMEPDVNISLKVPPGKSLALVGQSGAGKSTIMQLMMRQYDLRHGRDLGQVLIDGSDVRDLSPRWLLDHVGVVSQRPVVFNESIYFNVTYGYRREGNQTYHWGGLDRVVPEAEFWAAIKGANATDFITADILDDPEVVGEDGDKLSGGQRQRVAIARVLLRNPRLLFLDEATSALDPEGEWQVVEALRNISKGRTCVMIAHRLNTISHADHIIVLVKGRCVEEGTHTELLEMKGFYYDMYQKQQETHW